MMRMMLLVFSLVTWSALARSATSQSDPTNSVEKLFEYSNDYSDEVFEYAHDYSDFDSKKYQYDEEEKLKLLAKLENGVPMSVIERPMKSK